MRHLSTAAVCLTLSVAPAVAQQSADSDVSWRIRREATEHSQVMQTLHVLTDVYGPRLTGSPNVKAAGEWASEQMTCWGMKNARLEPWDFGHPGWMNERFSGFITAPVKDTLVGEMWAWTPGTNGTVAGTAVLIAPPDKPTQEEMNACIDGIKPQVKGRIVLVGRPATVLVAFNPVNKRREDAEVRAQYDPVNPAPSPFAAMMNQPPAKQDGPKRLTANEIYEQVDLAIGHEKRDGVGDIRELLTFLSAADTRFVSSPSPHRRARGTAPSSPSTTTPMTGWETASPTGRGRGRTRPTEWHVEETSSESA